MISFRLVSHGTDLSVLISWIPWVIECGQYQTLLAITTQFMPLSVILLQECIDIMEGGSILCICVGCIQ